MYFLLKLNVVLMQFNVFKVNMKHSKLFCFCSEKTPLNNKKNVEQDLILSATSLFSLDYHALMNRAH